MHKSRLVLNRPVYVGINVLDLSKHLMYDFYYNRLKAQYGERCQLLYTDTDSLLLEMQAEDLYKNMAKHADLYLCTLSQRPSSAHRCEQESAEENEG